MQLSPARPAWGLPIAVVVLLFAAALSYHNSFQTPFVYDDPSSIRDNPTIKSLWPLGPVLNPPSDSGVTVNGRPLLNLTLAVNYAVSGENVWSYHALNFLIHLGAGLLLFGLLRRAFALRETTFQDGHTSTLLAAAIAAVWLAHPIQTESVTYVIQRAESLVGFFFILGLYAFVRGLSSARSGFWLTLSVLACILGGWTKEVIATLPLVILLLDRALVSGTFAAAWQKRKLYYLALLGTWVLLGFTILKTGGRGGTAGLGLGVSPWHYLLTQSEAIVTYCWLSLWPNNLVFDYGTDVVKSFATVFWQFTLLVAVVGLVSWAVVRNSVVGVLGGAFFLILGPSSSVLPVITEPVAEHRMYLPLICLLVGAIAGLYRLIGPKGALLACAAALPAFVQLTVERNRDYSTQERIWRDTVQKYPTSARGHNNVGEILYRQMKFDEAIGFFQQAVKLQPDYVDALNNLGNILTQMGRFDEALPPLRHAEKIKPDYATTYANLGALFCEQGKLQEAYDALVKSIALNGEAHQAQNNIGLVLNKAGRPDMALPYLEKAIRLKPDHQQAHHNLADSLRALNRMDEAKAKYQESLRVNPKDAKTHTNLGVILMGEKQYAAAAEYFRAAIALNPRIADPYNNLGVALHQLGDNNAALVNFRKALEVRPDYPEARRNLEAVEAMPR